MRRRRLGATRLAGGLSADGASLGVSSDTWTYLYCRRGSHLAIYDDQRTYMTGLVKFIKDVDSGTLYNERSQGSTGNRLVATPR